MRVAFAGIQAQTSPHSTLDTQHSTPMIGLSIGTLAPNVWLTVLMWLTATAVCACLWAMVSDADRARYGGPLVALGAIAVLFATWLSPSIDVDEMEHLHASWLMSQGERPFVDFWQHHTPTLWIMLAPIVGRLPHNAAVCDLGRAMSLGASALACLLAVLLSRRLQGRGQAAAVVLLSLGAIIPSQLYNLRPDLFSNVCSLAALALLAQSRSLWRCLGSGVLMGLSISLTPKHAGFAAVLPMVLLSEALWTWWASLSLPWRRSAAEQQAPRRSPVRRAGRCLKRLAVLLLPVAGRSLLHVLGVALGIAPIIAWLHANGLWEQFHFWVLEFNRDKYLRFGGVFPLIPVLLVALWAWRIRAAQWMSIRPQERLLFVAVLAAAAVLIVQPFHKFMYDLQMFFLVAAACGAYDARQWLSRLFSTGRPVLAGILIGVYFIPTYLAAISAEEDETYIRNRTEIGIILNAIGDEPVVAVPPAHPILAKDATDLSQAWQWDRWIYVPAIRDRLSHIAEEIIQKRPVLVRAGGSQVAHGAMGSYARTGVRWQFVQTLTEARVIDPLQGFKLQDFLEAHYNLILVMDHFYWLRADRPVPPEAKMWLKAGSEG